MAFTATLIFAFLALLVAAELLLPRPEPNGTWLVADDLLGFKPNPASDNINSLGLRHLELEPLGDARTFRILWLGDSVSWDEGGFPTLVGRHLEKLHDVELVNASIPGYTTYQQRSLLERDLEPLGANLVLLQYCFNDNHQFLHELSNNGQWTIIREDRPARWRRLVDRSTVLRRVRWRLRGRERERAEQATRRPWETNEFAEAWSESSWVTQREHLRAIRDAAQRMGARFAVVAVPYEPQLDPSELADDAANTLYPQRQLAAITEQLGVPRLDLHPEFRAEHPGLYRDKIHLTPQGHELAAAAVLRFLESQALLEVPNITGPESQAP